MSDETRKSRAELNLTEEVAIAERTCSATVTVLTSDLQELLRDAQDRRGVTAMPLDPGNRMATVKMKAEFAQVLNVMGDSYLVLRGRTPKQLLDLCRLLHEETRGLLESARKFADQQPD